MFGLTKKGKEYYLILEKNKQPNRQADIISEIVSSTKIDIKNPVQLQIKANGDKYEFNYALNGNNFVNLGGIVSGDILSTDVAGGFTGCLLGLYATSVNDAQPE